MANTPITKRDALTFLNLDVKLPIKQASNKSTLENQINKGMQNAIHEYLVKEWGEYYLFISTDSFGIDRQKNDGEVIHTKNDTPNPINGEYRIVLPTDNGTTVKGKKVGMCFRLGLPQTYLKGVSTEACCYYTVEGVTHFYDEKGEVITEK